MGASARGHENKSSRPPAGLEICKRPQCAKMKSINAPARVTHHIAEIVASQISRLMPRDYALWLTQTLRYSGRPRGCALVCGDRSFDTGLPAELAADRGAGVDVLGCGCCSESLAMRRAICS